MSIRAELWLFESWWPSNCSSDSKFSTTYLCFIRIFASVEILDIGEGHICLFYHLQSSATNSMKLPLLSLEIDSNERYHPPKADHALRNISHLALYAIIWNLMCMVLSFIFPFTPPCHLTCLKSTSAWEKVQHCSYDKAYHCRPYSSGAYYSGSILFVFRSWQFKVVCSFRLSKV